jgi:hypothetical protein
MKKLLIIFLLFIAQHSLAQTTHYVSTTGSNSNSGTSGSPWLTLSYACTQVTTAGDTIYLNPGTYTESSHAVVAVGVSIKGADSSTTHLVYTYVADFNHNNPTDACIVFLSSTEGTDGNQSLSNLSISGDNLTATTGILIRCRGGVIIHDVHLKDFYTNGIDYQGSNVDPYTWPTTYPVGNQLYNSNIDNCTDTAETWVGGGCINMSGQKDLIIHDCILSDTSRGAGANGDIIVGNRYGKGFKYYNNTSYKPHTGADGWNFHLEIPSESAGAEIYNNNFYGGDQPIDVGNNIPPSAGPTYDYAYAYSYSIHDNYFYDPNSASTGDQGKVAVDIEGPDVKNIFVYNNTFQSIVKPFEIIDGSGYACNDSNIHIYKNSCLNCGINTSSSYEPLVVLLKSISGGSMKDIYIENNTIVPNPITHTVGLTITNNNSSTMTNIVIENNIFMNGDNGWWCTVDNTGSTMDSLYIRNNDLYNNPNSNAVSFTGNAVTNYTNANNIYTDPLFVTPNTDVHLQATSPNIDAGIDVGLPYYGTAPDIGAYEYGSYYYDGKIHYFIIH